jgi:hypothetical protein
MKTMIIASLFSALALVGCGAPVEDGSVEDVAAQSEALTGYVGHCQVTYNALTKVFVESGKCVGNSRVCGAPVASTYCLAGRAPVGGPVITCNVQTDTVQCQ